MQKMIITHLPESRREVKPPSRLAEIDALRGVAAIAVVLFH
jgi:peptidoglycan/LPS O-acetylase OafA/YrhL